MHHLMSWSVRRLWCAGFVPVCLILLLLLAMTPALAQDVSGIVSGTVTDPTDSVIPGALVKLTQASAGATKTLTRTPMALLQFILGDVAAGTTPRSEVHRMPRHRSRGSGDG